MRGLALCACGMVALLLAGCSPMRFAKAGAKPGDFENDKYDCEVQLGYAGHAGGNRPSDQLADYAVRGRSETKRCLERKGWRLVEE